MNTNITMAGELDDINEREDGIARIILTYKSLLNLHIGKASSATLKVIRQS